MSVSQTFELNTNSATAKGDPLTLTTETLITMYVKANSGDHNNHEVVLQISPDGTVWVPLSHPVLGLGSMTAKHSAAAVRAVVRKRELAPSTCIIHIVAK